MFSGAGTTQDSTGRGRAEVGAGRSRGSWATAAPFIMQICDEEVRRAWLFQRLLAITHRAGSFTVAVAFLFRG